MRSSVWMFLILLSFSTFCSAAEIALFSNHQRIEGYPFLVRSLKSGDVVSFSDGHSFTIDHRLGSGGTTAVYAIKEDSTKALRLPLGYEGMNFLGTYVNAADDLEKNNVPAVHVSEAYDEEYAVVDRLESFITFGDFVKAATQIESPGLLNRLGFLKIKNLPLDEMKAAFADFARRMAFTFVGDLHDQNLVYDFKNKRWILIDWTDVHSAASKVPGLHQLQFDTQSPFQILLKEYGYTSNLSFTASSKKYLWLQDMIEQGHQQMQQQRRRGTAIKNCAGVHFL
jgi:hypothetical protein